MQGLLNEWRRTNYTKNVTPDLTGQDVIVMGWVHEIRDLGGIIFVIIRDREGKVQITAPSKKVDAEILEDIRKLRKESVVAIKVQFKKLTKHLLALKLFLKKLIF